MAALVPYQKKLSLRQRFVQLFKKSAPLENVTLKEQKKDVWSGRFHYVHGDFWKQEGDESLVWGVLENTVSGWKFYHQKLVKDDLESHLVQEFPQFEDGLSYLKSFDETQKISGLVQGTIPETFGSDMWNWKKVLQRYGYVYTEEGALVEWTSRKMVLGEGKFSLREIAQKQEILPVSQASYANLPAVKQGTELEQAKKEALSTLYNSPIYEHHNVKSLEKVGRGLFGRKQYLIIKTLDEIFSAMAEEQPEYQDIIDAYGNLLSRSLKGQSDSFNGLQYYLYVHKDVKAAFTKNLGWTSKSKKILFGWGPEKAIAQSFSTLIFDAFLEDYTPETPKEWDVLFDALEAISSGLSMSSRKPEADKVVEAFIGTMLERDLDLHAVYGEKKRSLLMHSSRFGSTLGMRKLIAEGVRLNPSELYLTLYFSQSNQDSAALALELLAQHPEEFEKDLKRSGTPVYIDLPRHLGKVALEQFEAAGVDRAAYKPTAQELAEIEYYIWTDELLDAYLENDFFDVLYQKEAAAHCTTVLQRLSQKSTESFWRLMDHDFDKISQTVSLASFVSDVANEEEPHATGQLWLRFFETANAYDQRSLVRQLRDSQNSTVLDYTVFLIADSQNKALAAQMMQAACYVEAVPVISQLVRAVGSEQAAELFVEEGQKAHIYLLDWCLADKSRQNLISLLMISQGQSDLNELTETGDAVATLKANGMQAVAEKVKEKLSVGKGQKRQISAHIDRKRDY